MQIGDRVIMIHEYDPNDEIFRGDYGRIKDIDWEGDLTIDFKRTKTPNVNSNDYVIKPHEVMVCKKGMTWEQIRILADVVSGV